MKKRPLTYWEEYVTTDEWYKQKLIEDIPQSEMFAALEDEDVENDEESECEEDESKSCSSSLSDGFVEDEEVSEDTEYRDEDSECSSSSTDSDGSELCSSEEEEVQWTEQGERGGEGEDVEGASGSMGKAQPRPGAALFSTYSIDDGRHGFGLASDEGVAAGDHDTTREGQRNRPDT